MRCVTLSPILLHWSTSQIPIYLKGWSRSRFNSSKESRSTPASRNRRRASVRDFSMSGQNPAMLSSSCRFAASGDPGKTTPPTVRTVAILARASAPFQRSMARVSARRTRTSSNGFFFWFGVKMLPQFRSLSCTVILSPSAPTSSSRRRRQIAKIDRGAVTAYGVDPHNLLGSVETGEGVEIGQSLVIVIWVAHSLDRRADLIADEFEGARAQDILFVPPRILFDDLFLVDPAKGIGECRQKGARRELQMKHHGCPVGCLDLVYHHVVALARAADAFGRVDDLVPARRNVIGGERRAVMPFDAVADLEGVGLALLGGFRHLGAQIADKIGGRRGIVRIDPDQHAVKRRTRVDGHKRSLAVRVKARWRVRWDHIVERAATLRPLVGQCGNNKAYCTEHNCEHRRVDRHCPSSQINSSTCRARPSPDPD